MATPGVKIEARPSRADPDSMTFVVDRPIFAGGPFTFGSAARAAGAPLPAALFALPGVREVVIHGDSVVIAKEASAAWADLARQVGAAIRAQLLTGVPAILELAPQPDAAATDDRARRDEVQRVLDGSLNASVKAHGGAIRCTGVADGVVHVEMTGGCQGCAASSITLRQGVEVALRKALPWMRGLADDTDHGRGRTPFYRAL